MTDGSFPKSSQAEAPSWAHNKSSISRDALEALIADVTRRSARPWSAMHGVIHWRWVAYQGVEIAKFTRGADPVVAFFFGLFHDATRTSEHYDPANGARAALFIDEFAHLLPLTERQLDLLQMSCRLNDGVTKGRDPVIAACLDAERAHYYRLGIEPKPAGYATRYARTQVGNFKANVGLDYPWMTSWDAI